jgi:hypothetical protein
MSGNVVEFPGAEPVEIEWTQSMIDEVHGRAFRDLEKGIFDCATMSVIALQLAERAIEGTEPKADHAMFAVFHVADMLKKLKADYEAAFYAEWRVRS